MTLAVSVLIQYRFVTDRQPDRQTQCDGYYPLTLCVARVNNNTQYAIYITAEKERCLVVMWEASRITATPHPDTGQSTLSCPLSLSRVSVSWRRYVSQDDSSCWICWADNWWDSRRCRDNHWTFAGHNGHGIWRFDLRWTQRTRNLMLWPLLDTTDTESDALSAVVSIHDPTTIYRIWFCVWNNTKTKNVRSCTVFLSETINRPTSALGIGDPQKNGKKNRENYFSGKHHVIFRHFRTNII